MNRLNQFPKKFQASLESRSLLKVITGLSNFDRTSVAMVSKAAKHGGADFLDIACDPELVHLALKESSLPICVSSVEPQLFPKAVEAGAKIIEIGNFDSFYSKGRFFSSAEVLELTKQTRSLLKKVPLSVTVPHFLPLDKQAQLAIDLVNAGADLIQTEGGTSANPSNAGILGLVEKASPSLAATYAITKALHCSGLSTPVIAASGFSEVTIPMAISVGAVGVGVGSVVNKLTNELSMVAVIKRLREAASIQYGSRTLNYHLG